MIISGIEYESIVDGPGLRNTIFVSGCEHHCKGCHNPETWNPTNGYEFTKQLQEQFVNECKNNFLLKGITISGGDPLYIYKHEVLEFLKWFKQETNNKLSVWLYTGYTMTIETLKELYNIVDVVVDGEFELEKRDITLNYRGSPNQKIIDVNESIKQNKIMEMVL
jgi:anaerobic ribonucleoside-triphosphate reductase activating protein